MTNAEALSAPIVRAFELWVKDLLQTVAAAPEMGLLELLRAIREGLQPIVREVVKAAARSVGQYQRAPHCDACGTRMRSKGFQDRYLCSELGELRVPVRRWRCPSCGQEAQPWWAAAEVQGSWTKSLWDVALGLAVNLPYRTVERLLGQLGWPVSDTTLQEWVTRRGGELVAADAAAARRWEALAETPEPAVRPERLYVEVDGCKVRVPSGEGWREARVGVIFETAQDGVDEEGKPPPMRWKRIVSTVVREADDPCQADTFMRRVGLEMERCGARYAKEIVALCDGAPWIWDRLPGLVPIGTPAVEILDFYHAAQHLAKAARAVHGDAPAAFKACFSTLRQGLKLGRLRQVEAALAALELAAGEATVKDVQEVRSYFRTHRHRLSYLRLRTEGYYIGSGAVESGCKLMLARVRGAGMRWKEERLEAMLALRAAYLSEQWAPETVARVA